MAYINATIYESQFGQVTLIVEEKGMSMNKKLRKFLMSVLIMLIFLSNFSINGKTSDVKEVKAQTLAEESFRREDYNNLIKNPFGIVLMGLNPGETVKEIEVPNPKKYEVMVGTSLENIGLQSTLNVVYILPNDTEETRSETISWTSYDPANPYNKDQDGDYILKASFDDASIADLEIETVTVKVKGKALANMITALPPMSEAANYNKNEKLELRSKLITIYNELSILTTGERTLLEGYVGIAEMGKYQELYDEFVLKDGTSTDFLDGDWAFISRFEVVDIQDGTGPFDTSGDPNDPSYKDRPGNDCCPDNRIVRTFDIISYDLAYSTAVSGEYLGIKEGYMYYEFVLPYTVDKAMWEEDSMTWIGLKVNSIDELANKKDGESYYVIETKEVDGVMSQVLTGKKFLVPVEPNPSAFPGSGTLNAVLRVLNIDNGSTVVPKFSAWLEHNHLYGVCPVHNREEVKTVYGDAVEVTSELRLNVQLRQVGETQADGLDHFDFSTGNHLAMNKDAGIVYGRLIGYGITLQLYNLDPNDGLKGVAIPEGPITFDLDLSTIFKLNNGTIIDNLPDMYTPLVWSCEAQNGSVNQKDARNIKPYVPNRYAAFVAPGSVPINQPMGTYSPKTGINRTWNGGTWTGSQTGSKVSLTVDNYVINPNYFPNTDLGHHGGVFTYFNPNNGVRSTNIGCFSGGELFIIVPFGEGDDYLPTRYGDNGTIQFTITDFNLRASSATAGNLPIVDDNSNQTKPNRSGLPLQDDISNMTVYLAKPGSYENVIRYIKSQWIGHWCDIDGGISYIYNGKDTATRNQEFAIYWGMSTQPKGEQRNAAYGLNALMKFDPMGLEIVDAPHLHPMGGYQNPDTTATFLYATKPDGTNWISDAEMDSAVEEDLVYYKTLEEVPAGHIVVGILAEARAVNPMITQTIIAFSMQVKIKNDAETDKVYQIVQRTKLWLKPQYEAVGNNIPRRYDVGSSIVYPQAYLDDYSPGPYTKAQYTEGAYTSGHVGGTVIGDSVYVVPYKVAIKKEVAQLAGGQEKKNFDLDANQRVVDFKLTPSVKTMLPSQQEIKTTVVIVDTLPKGLSYISNSAYFGGTYIQDPISGRQGKVIGGQQIEPIVEYNSVSGETTLTWVIENVVVNEIMDVIIFSADIGSPGSPDDVVNNQHLLNKVSIRASEDNREKTKVHGNYDEVGIKVSKLLSTSLAKVPYEKYVESGENIGWKAYISNNGINPYIDTIILDTFPYNGDICGSKFDPATQTILQEWSIDTSLSTVENLSDWEFYYTTDTTVRGTLSQDYSTADIRAGTSVLENGDIVSWTKATLDPATGIISWSPADITALVAIGDLDGGKTLVQNVVLNTNPYLKAGDIFANTLSRALNEICSPVYVLQRSLEGLLWHDVNEDGIRQVTEELFNSGSVSLLIQDITGAYVPYLDTNGNPVTIPLGKQLDLASGDITDIAAGRYNFIGLPAGMFAVRFETDYIGEYHASPVNVGSDYTDSDATGEYSNGFLTSTVITGIKMPEKHEMASATYASRFNDSGLYKRKIELPVEKDWQDNNNQDGLRPGAVTIKLYANNVDTGLTLTLDQTNNWKDKFSNLVEYSNGSLISYTVKEVTVGNGYSTIIATDKIGSGYTVTNSRTPGTTSVTVNKVWDDNSNQDGLRTDVTLKLIPTVDGSEILWTDLVNASASGTLMDADGLVTLTKKANESHTFANLPVKYNGKTIVYTVEETNVPTGYTVSYNQNTLTVTNTRIPETTSITVNKVWADNNNQDGLRTDVTLKLVATVDGSEVLWTDLVNASASGNSMDADGLVTLTTKADESYIFANLPTKYQGKSIVYTVEETTVPTGYSVSYNQTTFTVTNTHTPQTTSVTVNKIWNDNGNQDGLRTDVTLKLIPTVDGSEILWTDLVNASASGTLMDADGLVTLTKKANESHTFANLPVKYNGKTIVYTVEETTVPTGYSVSYNQTTFTVTNTHTPQTTSVTVNKIWNDNGNQDGLRTDVTLKLIPTVDGSVILWTDLVDASASGNLMDADGLITLTTKADESHIFSNLPVRYKGKTIVYMVEETTIPTNYTVTYNQNTLTVTNTHSPDTTSVTVNKVWADNNNQDGLRTEVTPKLVATVDGSEVLWTDLLNASASGNSMDADGLVTLTTKADESYIFANLPTKYQGKTIVYTVEETTVPIGYSVSYNQTTFTVTNTHTPQTVSVTVNKVWDDNDNQDNLRTEVTLKLKASVNGSEVLWTDLIDASASGTLMDADGLVTLSTKADESHIFANLPAKYQGRTIVYTVEETTVPTGYEVTYNQNTLTATNTHTPDTTSITVNKVWNDNSNQDGLRTDVTLRLVATVNDVEVTWDELVSASASKAQMDADGLVTLTNKIDESHTFSNLPVNYQGSPIVYTVEEVEIPEGYIAEYNQQTLTVTNCHTPETIDIAGEKIWIDDDLVGRRPKSITIRLMNGDVEVDFVVVTEADGWSWSFEGVDKYENGELIEYTITEDEIKNYASEVEGYNVTNTYIPPVVPKTGDNFKPMVVTMVVLMSVSLAAIVGLSVYQYKSKKKNKK